MAHWIVNDYNSGRIFYRCSSCGAVYYGTMDDINAADKCPACGEDMDRYDVKQK